MSGWMKDDKGFLANDEYDVWRIPTDGTKAVRLTAGKETGTIYRLSRLDFEDNFIDPAKDMYFTAFGDIDKKSGYSGYLLRERQGCLFMMTNRYRSGKGKEQRYIYLQIRDLFRITKSFSTGYAFTSPLKISNTNRSRLILHGVRVN
jgi:hypothetical protein